MAVRMPWGFEWQVALRFLREGRMQSLMIVAGVAAGVAVVTYITALIHGLQANTVRKTLGTQAHISLRAPEDVVTPLPRPAVGDAVLLSDTQPRAQRLRSVANWQQLLPVLEREPGVIAVSPMVSGAGLALRGEASQSIALMGVELERYQRIVNLREKLVAGAWGLAPGEAMIGTELAADLGVRPGDRFTIATGAVNEPVRVTALLDLGLKDLNRRTVIIPLRSAQSLLGVPGGATVLEMQVADVWQADAIARQLRARYDYEVESWQDTNAQLLSALNAQTISTTVIRVVVLVVVVLGIASVLVVSVVQKRREIGILRAMGTTRGQVLRVFLLQGAVVGALGSVGGVLLSWAMVQLFTTLARSAEGGALFEIHLTLPDALSAALIATVCGVLAAVVPARRAASMDPAQAIRM
ncbi:MULTISPECIES: ABC transporter permease [Comamonas]|jgi:lipoprotein-releasing system permease protein|uniref:ABC transporter permease n=1 Tax=Comamonas TaxID=283 RepID=UPI001EEBF2F6|nr:MULTISPECIES: FtsX-like permease family protein [Comamonas]MDE1553864.1 FtsX-like permease family protein [Comamonas aquatica]